MLFVFNNKITIFNIFVFNLINNFNIQCCKKYENNEYIKEINKKNDKNDKKDDNDDKFIYTDELNSINIDEIKEKYKNKNSIDNNENNKKSFEDTQNFLKSNIFKYKDNNDNIPGYMQ